MPLNAVARQLVVRPPPDVNKPAMKLVRRLLKQKREGRLWQHKLKRVPQPDRRLP